MATEQQLAWARKAGLYSGRGRLEGTGADGKSNGSPSQLETPRLKASEPETGLSQGEAPDRCPKPPQDSPATNGNGQQAMLPDCMPVKGKVPGPANHLYCCKHHHVVDVTARLI